MKKFILILSLIIVLISCQEDNTIGSRSSSNNSILASALPSDPVFDDLIDQYDTTDITGLITLDYSKYNWSRTYTSDLLTSEHVQSHANFFENGEFNNQFEVDSLTWENTSYVNVSHMVSNLDDTYGLPFASDVVIFADSNHVKLDSNAKIVGFDEMIYIDGKPAFTGINPGDTISKSSNLNLTWSNSSNQYSKISLKHTDMYDTTGSSTSNMYNHFLVDNGGHTIPSPDLSGLVDGNYFLLLTIYNPTFIDLSDGKKVCLLYTSKYEIDIYLD